MLSMVAAAAGAGGVGNSGVGRVPLICGVCVWRARGGESVRAWRGGVREGGLPQREWRWGRGGWGGVVWRLWLWGMVGDAQVDVYRAARRLDYAAHLLTAVGFEPTPFRTGTWNQRLRPIGHTVLRSLTRVVSVLAPMLSLVVAAAGAGVATAAADVSMRRVVCARMGWGREGARV